MMELKLKTITRRIPTGKNQGVSKEYITIDNQGEIDLDMAAELISDNCSLSSADVKATVEILIWLLTLYLKKGYVIKLGGLGSFHLTVSSRPVEVSGNNKKKAIRKIKIQYRPGMALRQMIKGI